MNQHQRLIRVPACTVDGLTEMTAQEVLDKINAGWVDKRYKLCLVPTQQPDPDIDPEEYETVYSNQKKRSNEKQHY